MSFPRILVIGIALLGTTVASPWTNGDETRATPPPRPEFYPLAIGNTWTYFTTTRDEASGKVDETYEETNLVRGMIEFEGEVYFHVREFSFGIWTRNTPKGMDDIDCVIDEETNELTVVTRYPSYYRYPTTKGANYKLFSESDEDPPQRMHVIEVDELIKTDAGEFRCVCYEMREGEGDEIVLAQRTWICPGVGIVKYEVYGEKHPVITSLLTSYKFAVAAKK